MSNSITDKAHDLKDAVTRSLHDAGEYVVDMKDTAAKQAGKKVDALGKLMKHHPILALGVALGGGYLLARLVHHD